MSGKGLKGLVTHGNIALLDELRSKGVVPDFNPADWLQTALSQRNIPMLEYLADLIAESGKPFPDVITDSAECVESLLGAGYSGDRLLVAALQSGQPKNIKAVLVHVRSIEDSSIIEQILRAGVYDIGDIILDLMERHPEHCHCIVSGLIRSGNTETLRAIRNNPTVSVILQNTPTETLRELVNQERYDMIRVILNL